MTVSAQALYETDFQFDEQKAFYKGKVRDVYHFEDKLVMIATDRISAFDHILPKPIPYKGQVLNLTATHFLEATKGIVPNWLLASPHPNVAVGLICEPIKIEMVIRGYLAGHAWRLYKAGERTICGVTMPDGMKESDPFPEPLITPATKADEGHDEDISREEILAQGIVSEEVYQQLESYTRALFKKGTEMAEERGLILVDTKYEFGWHDGQIYLIDEVHTPDSSRYYYLEGYDVRQAAGEKQQQLSKEFVREWLMAHGFQGLEDQLMPMMPEEFVRQISDRYIALYEMLTGNKFDKEDTSNLSSEIHQRIINYLAASPET